MSANNPQRNADQRQPGRKIRDLPGCIKYIILLFLLLLLFAEWYAGEFRGFPDVSRIVWIVLLFKLLLIILLIILIWVQRQLNCELTAPNGCTNVEYDPATDKWFIKVMGTAAGTMFGSYQIVAERPLGTPLPDATISYPGGGSSGTAIVNNGELGRIEVNIVPPGPAWVTLTVFPSGAGSPCIHTNMFDWANRNIGIDSIGAVEARWVGGVKLVTGPPLPAPHGDPASVGGGITVEGTADYTGCGREMVEYDLDHKIVNVGELPWSGSDPGPWAPIQAPLAFGDPAHPRTFAYLSGGGMATHFNSVPSRGKLTRVWSIGSFLMPPPPPPENFASRPFTPNAGWNTGTEGDPSPPALNGRYTVRLLVKHELSGGGSPGEIYDTATVWIDNRRIEGRITGMAVAGAPLGACDELLMSLFITPNPLPFPAPPPAPGFFKKKRAEINGRAWDPIILDSYPHTDEPNDNFNLYTLDYKKDGDVSFSPLVPTPVAVVPAMTGEDRVPNTLQQAPLAAYPADTGLLYAWDIVAALDAGPRPTPYVAPPPGMIYRGERCAYLIVLQVTDKTLVSEGTTHYIRHDWPFCIMNDLPDGLEFPVTTFA